MRQDDLEWRQIGDDVVVLDLRSGNYLTFNSTGVVLFQRLVGGATTDELVQSLLAEYHTTAEIAATDVAAFIEVLSTHGLLADPTGQ